MSNKLSKYVIYIFIGFLSIPLNIFMMNDGSTGLKSDDLSWFEEVKRKKTSESEGLSKLFKRSRKSDVEGVKKYLGSLKSKMGCGSSQYHAPNIDEKGILVFMSFSIPDQTWIELSKSLEGEDAVFVLRGIPENSFSELIKKVKGLKEKGVSTTIQINPKQFERYQVEHVPTFVKFSGEAFDKLSGNVSFSYFLSRVEEEGDTKGDGHV